MIRLDKYLADRGAGTRSELKKAIRKGQAAVDGVVISDPGHLLNGEEQVFFSGIDYTSESMVYYMLNKPAGVISATKDPEQKTVMNLLEKKDLRKDLFPVGRLDKDTEGLLLITNDGEMGHILTSPKHHVDKTYYAKVDGELTRSDQEAFEKGVVISDEFTARSAELLILNSGAVSKAEVTVREGKFHQVRRMFAARGKEVIYLKRLSMGPIKLDASLKPGEYRNLTEEELTLLKEIR